ncbi:hypothetical protein HQ560_18015, partial [bacterium]|nr:hypothetical protein [bacterium]
SMALILACLLAGLGVRAHGGARSIVDTPHNLSVTGPGPIKSATETQICIFCHTPHNADPRAPLWNRTIDSGTTYITYASPTFQPGVAPQPDGASKLCLSCHDGTIALGQVRSRSQPIPVSGGPTLSPGQSGYIGTDLSGSHPVSFVYDDALAIENNTTDDMPLRLPSTLSDPDVKLDKQGKLQCTACHDPHDDSNYSPGIVPHFYVKPTWSGLCLTCHDF